MDNAYTYIADLAKEVTVPQDGILSRIPLHYAVCLAGRCYCTG